MLPPPDLVVGALRLRSLTAADWPLHQRLSRVPDIVQWTLYEPDLSDEDAQQFASRSERFAQEGRLRRYGVSMEGDDLGMVGISTISEIEDEVEVFYALLPSGRGRGAATMAVQALTDWSLAHGASRVRLSTIIGNAASEGVARRAGFVVEGKGVRSQRGADVEVLRWVRPAPTPPVKRDS